MIRAGYATIFEYLDEGKTEEIRKYLNKMTHNNFLYSAKSYTGNKSVDAILSSLCKQASEMGIVVRISGSLGMLQGISSYELCSIFYNLTQNAIEACEKLPSDINREIVINMAQVHNDYLNVSFENPVAEKVLILKEGIETTKKDKLNHGIGLKSVTDIVNKYDGSLRLSCDECIFRADVILHNSK